MPILLPNSHSHYADLVDRAIRTRSTREQATGVTKIAMDSINESRFLHEVLITELSRINQHIQVEESLVAAAAKDYERISEQLIQKLKWETEEINVLPQGSSSTRTLIKSPSAEKFDIDAVCKVALKRHEVWDPMQFFHQFKPALTNWTATPKNRCWRIDGLSNRYYVEFTPSVPLSRIPSQILDQVLYRQTSRYSNTALAVVDCKTKLWKTSNPEGLSQWVEDQSKRQLVALNLFEKRAAATMDSIEPVPEQSVALSDTLRVAIRLCKRHRDMMVDRALLDGEFKPISVIIVTLLTQCYEGLADKGFTYTDHLNLLQDLLELMPGMIEKRNHQWWIENPTVDGENFAERWNTDKGECKQSFDCWCKRLETDLSDILNAPDASVLRNLVHRAFGTTAASAPTPPSSGIASKTPTSPLIPPASTGLA